LGSQTRRRPIGRDYAAAKGAEGGKKKGGRLTAHGIRFEADELVGSKNELNSEPQNIECRRSKVGIASLSLF
jgi:hypothetical protein